MCLNSFGASVISVRHDGLWVYHPGSLIHAALIQLLENLIGWLAGSRLRVLAIWDKFFSFFVGCNGEEVNCL